jgi:hypothetical protein
MKVIAIIIGLFFAACNSNNFLYLEGNDEDTKTILKNLIVDFNASIGCEAWSDTPSLIKLSNGEIGRRKIKVFHSAKMVAECDRKAFGCFNFWTNEISFVKVPFYNEYRIKTILLHEIGHAMLGEKHYPNTVMNEKLMVFVEGDDINSLIELLNEHNKNPCKIFNEKE